MIELSDGLTPIETEIGYYILKNSSSESSYSAA